MELNPYSQYDERAKAIINGNKYMTLATADKSGNPWASPVYYTFDENYDLYFLSAMDSKHVKNMMENPVVSAAIFDSHAPIGISEGVQLRGNARPLQGKELARAIKLYSARIFSNSHLEATERYNPDDYIVGSRFRFFKVDVEAVYVTGVDRRIDVDFKKKDQSK